MKGAAAVADGEMWRWKGRKIRERDRCMKKTKTNVSCCSSCMAVNI